MWTTYKHRADNITSDRQKNLKQTTHNGKHKTDNI